MRQRQEAWAKICNQHPVQQNMCEASVMQQNMCTIGGISHSHVNVGPWTRDMAHFEVDTDLCCSALRKPREEH